ncbi:hypothetical protein BDF19DRAFT_485311 [Syncephalis fuscata]|nr:hypothetical protein BDF19DRAFT_485311 [Syncephalis fuscata]
MIKISIFTIAAACIAVLLSSTPTSTAVNGNLNGKVALDGIGKKYLDDLKKQNKPKLESVDWKASNEKISFGYTKWGKDDAFIKCMLMDRWISNEIKVFAILNGLKNQLNNAPGKNNIQQPLETFDIPDPNDPKKIHGKCFIYSFAYGKALDKFIFDKSWEYKAKNLPQIFYQTLQGVLYLRRAGIIHKDIALKNIVAGVHPVTNQIVATVVDYDVVQFMYPSVEETVKLAPSTSLAKMNSNILLNSCDSNNELFSETIYHAITGALYDDEAKSSEQDPFELLKSNLSALLNNQQIKSGDQCADENNRVPQYPTKLDVKHTQALKMLVNFMTELYDTNQSDCGIAESIINLLKSAHMQ